MEEKLIGNGFLNVLVKRTLAGRNLERETGIEPATSSLGSWHSTTELLPPLGAVTAEIVTLCGLLQNLSVRFGHGRPKLVLKRITTKLFCDPGLYLKSPAYNNARFQACLYSRDISLFCLFC